MWVFIYFSDYSNLLEITTNKDLNIIHRANWYDSRRKYALRVTLGLGSYCLITLLAVTVLNEIRGEIRRVNVNGREYTIFKSYDDKTTRLNRGSVILDQISDNDGDGLVDKKEFGIAVRGRVVYDGNRPITQRDQEEYARVIPQYDNGKTIGRRGIWKDIKDFFK